MNELEKKYKMELQNTAAFFGLTLSDIRFNTTHTGNLTGSAVLDGSEFKLPKVNENDNLQWYVTNAMLKRVRKITTN